MSQALKKHDAETDLTEHQKELEYLFSKNQLIPRIRAEFTNPEAGFIEYLEKSEFPVKFGIALLVQMAIHKRANLPTIVGLLQSQCNSAQETADLLLKAAELDLVDWDETQKLFIVRYDLPDEVQQELDRFQFPLPMVVPPKHIKDNFTSGYLLNESSVILRKNHHDDDVCLDHLNRTNKIKLAINDRVVDMVKNSWRNLDKAKPGETLAKFRTRKRAFEKYDRVAKDVIATLRAHSDEFYMTHRYDKRGRVYCMGYHVTYQGNPWNKACIEFSEKEII